MYGSDKNTIVLKRRKDEASFFSLGFGLLKKLVGVGETCTRDSKDEGKSPAKKLKGDVPFKYPPFSYKRG